LGEMNNARDDGGGLHVGPEMCDVGEIVMVCSEGYALASWCSDAHEPACRNRLERKQP
jgi:hypothetical protein